MKRSHNLTALAMLSALAFYGSGLFAHYATAAERLGTAILDTCALPLLPDGSSKIAVYGDIRAVNRNTVTIRGQQPHDPSVLVDIQRMDRNDIARLAATCTHAGCLEVMTGVVLRGRLRAERSYPLTNGFVSPSACADPAWRARVAKLALER